ncbi:fused MFS/spermidine synthase, partial [Candidatus Micrarchaeota archaeon]|nr:fused MFS/spermidine synthase [Candidatus Micrarchaeota archaeon]
GLVMAALSLGYYLGGRFGDRYKDITYLSTIFYGAAIATAIIPLLANLILPLTLFTDLIFGGLLGGLILVPASVFYGLVSPYIIKLEHENGKEGEVAGKIFAFSTVGSIIGVFTTGFILIPNIQLTHIFILAGAIMILAATVFLGKINSLKFGLFLVVLIFMLNLNPVYSIYNGKVVFAKNSEYYNIAVLENVEWNGKKVNALILDTEISSGLDENNQLIFPVYKKMEEIYRSVEEPKTILVLGVGGGTQIENMKVIFPKAQIEGVEIDKEVVEVAKHYFGLREDKGTDIIVDDARRYLKRNTNKKYDLIVVDVFRSISIPAHLASREFVAELKSHLNYGGTIIVNTISIREDRMTPLTLIYNSYKKEFEYSYLVMLEEEKEVLQNNIIIARNVPLVGNYTEHDFSYDKFATDEWNPIEILSRSR